MLILVSLCIPVPLQTARVGVPTCVRLRVCVRGAPALPCLRVPGVGPQPPRPPPSRITLFREPPGPVSCGSEGAAPVLRGTQDGRPPAPPGPSPIQQLRERNYSRRGTETGTVRKLYPELRSFASQACVCVCVFARTRVGYCFFPQERWGLNSE